MLEHFRRATVALGHVVTDGGKEKFVTLGSAVLVATDPHHACLLTAKHMVYSPKDGYFPTVLQVRLAREKDDPTFGIELPLVVAGQNLWRTLDDGSDLAVIGIPQNLSLYKNLHAIGINEFGGVEDVFQGAPVIILGFPAIAAVFSKEDDILISPIARSGIVAWVDPERKLDKPLLVDANIFNGNSGGPVFHLRNGLTKSGGLSIGGGLSLIGIMSQDGSENAPVKVGDQPVQNIDPRTGSVLQYYAEVKNIGSIGLVEPAAKAKLLVEKYCR